jgi:hypothetical protein
MLFFREGGLLWKETNSWGERDKENSYDGRPMHS